MNETRQARDVVTGRRATTGFAVVGLLEVATFYINVPRVVLGVLFVSFVALSIFSWYRNGSVDVALFFGLLASSLIYLDGVQNMIAVGVIGWATGVLLFVIVTGGAVGYLTLRSMRSS